MRIYGKQNPEHIEKRVVKNKGKKRTEAQKENIRCGMCAYCSKYEVKETIPPELETASQISVKQSEVKPLNLHE